jgi:predicted nucleotidyltransferase component of viral defense system
MQEKLSSGYYKELYKIQDDVLRSLQNLSKGFYLTGGTALSRGYLNHRYSDDLDLFIHGEDNFIELVRHILANIKALPYTIEVERLHETFSRVMISSRNDVEDTMILKVDFVNEKHLPHIGQFIPMDFFHRVDNMRNILSNKICALTRLEAKDVADIWCICTRLSFAWDELIDEANQKNIVEEMMVVDLLRTFPGSLLDRIKWMIPFSPCEFEKARDSLLEDIITKRRNSLFRDHPGSVGDE